MLYPIEIINPFEDFYGSVKRIKLPQEIEMIKSVSINIADLKEFTDHIMGLPVEVKFDLFKFSLLLNNGNDEVLADALGQLSFFQKVSDWNGGTPFRTRGNYYNKQKIILNKKVIKNAVHFGVFKMSDDLIDYLNIPSVKKYGTISDYIRNNNMKLTLYIEA